jgi:hypothetical protein
MSTNTPNEILAAAGLSDLSGPRADFAYNKIISDGEILLIAERLSREAFIAAAVRSMDPGQLNRLRKRSRPEPAPVVRWVVTISTISQRPLLTATFGKEQIFFDGTPEKAAALVWHGEKPPVRALQEYTAAFNPNAPVLDAAYWHTATNKEPRAPQFDPITNEWN